MGVGVGVGGRVAAKILLSLSSVDSVVSQLSRLGFESRLLHLLALPSFCASAFLT